MWVDAKNYNYHPYKAYKVRVDLENPFMGQDKVVFKAEWHKKGTKYGYDYLEGLTGDRTDVNDISFVWEDKNEAK